MNLGNVTNDQYCTGLDAVKWTLMEKRLNVKNLEYDLSCAIKELRKVESDLKQIIGES